MLYVSLLALAPAFVSAVAPRQDNPWWQPGGGTWWDPNGGWGAKPLTSTEYQSRITLEGLLTHSRALNTFGKNNGNTRAFATKGYNQSVEYVEKIARDAGLDVRRQTVLHPGSTIRSSSLVVDGETLSGVDVFMFSAPTPAEGITAPVFLVNGEGCVASDYAGAEGKIAFAKRGTCTFVSRAQIAFAAGVSSLVIYNNQAGSLSGASISTDWDNNPPTIALAQTVAAPIVAKLAAGASLTGTISIDIESSIRASDNVIAETRWGDKKNVVFVGAHLDSVAAGSGVNDDGSGTATVAELLKQLAKFKNAKNAVRFAWWTAEEVGLIGSIYYVEQLSQAEKDNILAYINLDMTASPNYVLGIHDGDFSAGEGAPAPAGSGALEKLYQDWHIKKGFNYTSSSFSGGSDYQGFIDNGIVSGGMDTGAGGHKTAEEVAMFGGQADVQYDSCYHQACDDIDNLAHDAYLWIAQATAHVIATLALDESPIKKEQGILAAGLRVAGPQVKEIVSNTGHDTCSHPEI